MELRTVCTRVSPAPLVLAYLYVSRYKDIWLTRKRRRKHESSPACGLQRAEENRFRIWVRTGNATTRSSRSKSRCDSTQMFLSGSKGRAAATKPGSTMHSGSSWPMRERAHRAPDEELKTGHSANSPAAVSLRDH